MRGDASVQIARFFRFMRLFEITMFSLIRVEPDQIFAVVAWKEACREGIPEKEEVQKVLWMNDRSCFIDDALIVGEHAHDAGWIKSDHINVDKNRIIDSLGWNNERVSKAVDQLLRIRVRMIDNGDETDAFFLHT